jgi:hypothetical protein
VFIAETNAALDFAWAVLMFVLFGAWIATLIMMYFVIWSRKDWMLEARVAATILVSFGIFLPIVGVAIYGIVDVATRRKLTGGAKAAWIAAIVLLPGLGAFIYFIWALRPSNKPSAPEHGTPPPPPTTADGSRALTSNDLDYLQKLTDLHNQGTLTDEQYTEQRQQVIDKTGAPLPRPVTPATKYNGFAIA